jgi:aconitase B
MINDVYISLQPHSPDNRALASECKDVKIDRVYIGSCTGGKTEDFMAAAKVFLTSVRSLTSLLYMLHNSFVTYILAWIKSLFFSSFHFILFTLSGV